MIPESTDRRATIGELRRFWDALALDDPLWAVLSDPERRGRRWDLNEFMKTGEREVALLFHRLQELGLPCSERTALDFGCGVGRLTQALARRFSTATGVDISSAMIDLARRVSRRPNAFYVQSPGADPNLEALPAAPFDFIYSNIVLQHVPPDLAARCIGSMSRALAPQGVLVFQLPSHRIQAESAVIMPMPSEAYGASIGAVNIPTTMPAGEPATVSLDVRNTSAHVWSQPSVGSIRVGNHWFDAAAERMIVQDDGRAVLPQVVAPGQCVRISLPVTAPAAPGTYALVIDVVHEGVTWFEHKQSVPLRVEVSVDPGDVGAVRTAAPVISEHALERYEWPAGLAESWRESPASTDGQAFPMHGIDRLQVEDLVRECGGTVVHVEDDPRAGGEWASYRYFVRK